MKKNRKFLAPIFALLATLALAAFAACDKNESSSSPSSEASSSIASSSFLSSTSQSSSLEEQSSTEESSITSSTEESSITSSQEESSSSRPSSSSASSSSFSGDTTDQAPLTEWSEWVCDPDAYSECKQPTCTEEGVKLRYKLADENITETAAIPARGHDYAIDSDDVTAAGRLGKCIRCQDDAMLSMEIPSNPTFITNAQACAHTQIQINTGKCSHTYQGNGTRYVNGNPNNDTSYNLLSLQEGCYELTIKKVHETDGLWITFSAPSNGQYVFYSIGENEGVGFTVSRYNFSGGFLPESYTPAYVENGNFYSFVNPGHSSEEAWMATYRIQGTFEDTVKVCFAKYDEKIWQRGNVTSYAYASEINQTTAPEKPEGTELKNAPYDTAYYFDQTTGYYRMGTSADPGAIIYAAIDKTSRQFVDGGKFTTLDGQALNLQDGYTAEGDNRIRNYVPMIMNWKYNDAVTGSRGGAKPEVNPTKNCYQNYCNADGVYPATKELYKFLNLYVRANRPMDEYITDDDWQAEKLKDLEDSDNWLWLANCYYYADLNTGTENNPTLLTLGSNTVSVPEFDFLFVKVENSALYTISWTDSNLQVRLNGSLVSGTQITVQAPFTLKLSDAEGNANEFTLTLAYAATTQAVNTETTTLSPVTVYMPDATTTTVYTRYEYTPTANGTLTFTRTGSEEATVTVNGEEVTASKDVQVTVDTPVVILVTADTPVDIAVTLAFLPAV